MIQPVKRLSPNQPIKRLINGVAPYTTQTGVQIGVFYQDNPSTRMSETEEFWQGVLLGIEPEWSRRRIAKYATYMAFIFFVVMASVKVGW